MLFFRKYRFCYRFSWDGGYSVVCICGQPGKICPGRINIPHQNSNGPIVQVYLVCLLLSVNNFACLSVCLFVTNKRKNGWTDRAQILWRTWRDPREGLWMLKITKSCIQKFLIFVKFWKCAKKYLIREFFVVVDTVLYKGKMDTDRATIKN